MLDPMPLQFKASLFSPFEGQTLAPVNDELNQDLDFLRELIEAGKITPMIDKTVPMRNFSEAMRHVSGGHASGRVVITVEE